MYKELMPNFMLIVGFYQNYDQILGKNEALQKN